MADRLFGISLRDQRIKWLLVVGLAAVLLAVIIWGGEAPPVQATAPAAAGARQGDAARPSAPASRKVAVTTTGKSPAKSLLKKSLSRWNVAAVTKDELELTLKFNPFAFRPSLQSQLPGSETALTDPNLIHAQEELAEKARALAAKQRLSEFKGRKVSVLLRTSDGGSAALIGGRLVREGDIVDGIRVLSISTDGVVVEAVPTAR